jgi:DNA polymerase alpha-associated DNA helicase A
MTRPKRHLAIIGDSETVSRYVAADDRGNSDRSHNRGSSFLKRWMKFLEEHADLRYPNLDDLQLD